MIRVVVDDLAFVSADAVIRPTTAALEPTSPSLRNLEQVAGPAFHQQLQVHQELAVGSAVVTGAGDLAADFVIHAVLSSYDQPVTSPQVRRALLSVLQRAEDWQLASLAIPPLGTGPGNLDLEDAANLMIQVLGETLVTVSYPREVYIVVDNDEERTIFEKYIRTLPQ